MFTVLPIIKNLCLINQHFIYVRLWSSKRFDCISGVKSKIYNVYNFIPIKSTGAYGPFWVRTVHYTKYKDLYMVSIIQLTPMIYCCWPYLYVGPTTACQRWFSSSGRSNTCPINTIMLADCYIELSSLIYVTVVAFF